MISDVRKHHDRTVTTDMPTSSTSSLPSEPGRSLVRTHWQSESGEPEKFRDKKCNHNLFYIMIEQFLAFSVRIIQ